MELHLTDAERAAERALQRQHRDGPGYVQMTVVLLLDKGRSVPYIADDLGLDPATVYRYAAAHQTQGVNAWLRPETGGYWGLLTSAQLGRLCQELPRVGVTHLSAAHSSFPAWVAQWLLALLVGLLLLPAGGARAQAVQAGRPLPPVPDSLQGLTRRATTPVARMDALQRVAEAYSSQSDSTGALAYGRALGALARQQHSALYEAIALHLQSTAYYEMPLLPQALRLSLQALPLRTDVRLANTQALLGKIYDDLHQTSKALAMMRAARRTYQAAGMRRQAFSVDNSMGVLFFANYQLDSADFYMLRAAQGLHTLPGMEKREAATLVNLASVQQQRLQYAAQARYSRQALALFRAVHDSTQLGAVFNNLCAAARALDSLPQAIRYARQSLRLNRQFRRLNGEQAALNNLGSCFLKLRQTDSAAVYFRQALASTRKGGVPDNQGRYLQQLAETAEAAHQPAEALRLALEVEALDSIHRNAATTLVNLTLLAKLAQARHDDAAALTYFQRQRALEQRQAAANSSKEMASLRVKFGTERTEQQLATASGPAASAGRPIRRPAFAQKGHVFVILPITQIRA